MCGRSKQFTSCQSHDSCRPRSDRRINRCERSARELARSGCLDPGAVGPMAKGPAGLGTQVSAPGQRWPLHSIEATERARTLPGRRPFSFFFLLCLFFFNLCPHVGVFWPNQISPYRHSFVDYLFLYLFLLNKYVLIFINSIN
jgi:hypothetical protein